MVSFLQVMTKDKGDCIPVTLLLKVDAQTAICRAVKVSRNIWTWIPLQKSRMCPCYTCCTDTSTPFLLYL